MESHYVNRNVDLSLLNEWLERFFKEKGFMTLSEETDEGYRIFAKPRHIHDIIGKVSVFISGDPNDFVVKFYSGAFSGSLVKFGNLTTLFGGGIMVLRGLKSQEAEEKLERSFAVYLNESVNSLAGSARK